jgi:hypothetical protein
MQKFQHDYFWIFTILSCGYLFPGALALGRGLKNGWSIMIVNALLGWTLVGWVVALAWAASGTAEKAA